MILQETFTLSNGVTIPKIGFGTWQIPEGDDAYNSTLFALKNGYRHIDTAFAYGNEKSVGRAVRDSGIPRSEIFVTSKLPAEIKTYEGAVQHFNETMNNLDIEYLDLYLIHAPWPWNARFTDHTQGNIEVWKAFEEFYNDKRCRSIGVSNFDVKDLQAIEANCTIKPMVNQIRYFIGYTQDEITSYCQANDILVQGYSPLATGNILNNQRIEEIANKYNKAVSQVCIRYLLQHDVLPLPKSVHEEYILKNADVDFVISDEDMAYLDSLPNSAGY